LLCGASARSCNAASCGSTARSRLDDGNCARSGTICSSRSSVGKRRSTTSRPSAPAASAPSPPPVGRWPKNSTGGGSGGAARAGEAEGLEARRRNQRNRLTAQERRLAQVEAALQARPEEPAIPLPPARVPVAVALSGPPTFLGRLAGDLTDQRRHLLEQWQR